MYFKTLVAAAVLSVAAVTTASASSLHNVYDHEINGSPEHGLWFSNDGSSPANPDGATGSKPNHFLFSNSAAGSGALSIDDLGNAVLSGTVLNDNGQGFDLEMNIKVDTVTNYDAKGPKGNPNLSEWTFFSLVSGSLTSIDATLKDYTITGLMSASGKNYGVQMGLGANDKDIFLGLSSWIFMQETGCSTCEVLSGDINVSLIETPLPAGAVLLPAGLALMGGLRMRRRKKAQS